MNFSLQKISKLLFLVIASLNLGFSSGVYFLGILFALGFVFLEFKQAKNPPLYKKSLAYGGIFVFALWWFLMPKVEYGISPWIIYVPAFYVLYLCFLQKRSLNNGGFEVFVAFNGGAVLLASFYGASRAGLIFGALGILFALRAYSRPKTALWKNVLFVLLFVLFCSSSFFGWNAFKRNHHYSGKYSEKYFQKNRMMGFDPVVFLGSFASNYSGTYNEQVVLRIWDTLTPEYLRAAVYEKYGRGVWKLPEKAEKKLYSHYYDIDYGIFELADSLTFKKGTKKVWVQSALENFGFIFAPPKALGVALKNADSIDYFSTHVFTSVGKNTEDWYYYIGDFPEEELAENDSTLKSYLQIPKRDRALVDSIAFAMNLNDILAKEIPSKIALYFLDNFEYSLKVERSKNPLRKFWESKKGFCEYYATLSVLLLRSKNIPARYVTGFAHPEHHKENGYSIFRRLHAHAWVEVYLEGEWHTFDPTPPQFVLEIPAVSAFDNWSEKIKAKYYYILHILKDGEWRKSVDSLEGALQNFFTSIYFYGIIAALIFAIIILKIKRSKPKKILNENIKYLVAQVNRAEKELLKLHIERRESETIKAFSTRIENAYYFKNVKHQKRFEKNLQLLKDYEAKRWKI